MKELMIVGLGGFFGSVCRYGLSVIGARWNPWFPIATFSANVLGCLLIGLLIAIAAKNSWLSRELQLLLGTGFCGGFTTFSTFSAENVQLMQQGQYLTAALYLAGSLLAGILAVALGLWLVK